MKALSASGNNNLPCSQQWLKGESSAWRSPFLFRTTHLLQTRKLFSERKVMSDNNVRNTLRPLPHGAFPAGDRWHDITHTVGKTGQLPFALFPASCADTGTEGAQELCRGFALPRAYPSARCHLQINAVQTYNVAAAGFLSPSNRSEIAPWGRSIIIEFAARTGGISNAIWRSSSQNVALPPAMSIAGRLRNVVWQGGVAHTALLQCAHSTSVRGCSLFYSSSGRRMSPSGGKLCSPVATRRFVNMKVNC